MGKQGINRNDQINKRQRELPFKIVGFSIVIQNQVFNKIFKGFKAGRIMTA